MTSLMRSAAGTQRSTSASQDDFVKCTSGLAKPSYIGGQDTAYLKGFGV
jgi:hypothetical protein